MRMKQNWAKKTQMSLPKEGTKYFYNNRNLSLRLRKQDFLNTK